MSNTTSSQIDSGEEVIRTVEKNGQCHCNRTLNVSILNVVDQIIQGHSIQIACNVVFNLEQTALGIMKNGGYLNRKLPQGQKKREIQNEI